MLDEFGRLFPSCYYLPVPYLKKLASVFRAVSSSRQAHGYLMKSDVLFGICYQISKMDVDFIR